MSEKTVDIGLYSYVNNTPILMIDKYGKYAVTVHYQMTYKALLKLGYSRKEADIIAHYSSTYSDHPTNSVLHADVTLHGNTTMRQVGYRPTIDYRRTVNSQGEENSMWHSMMSDEEAKNGMTEREAMQRGLEFGWNNVFEYATSKEKKDLGKLGQGLHTYKLPGIFLNCNSSMFFCYFILPEDVAPDISPG